MSTQQTRATINKKRSEKRITNKLAAWIQDIVANYRIGDTTVSETSVPILTTSLRTSYTQAGKDVLRFDIREYKQANDELKDEIYTAIARKLDPMYNQRTDRAVPQITKTSSKLTARTTELAVENQMSDREAKITLLNYLKSQRLMIARTESQWVVEATRNVAVVSIKDPLDNTLEQLVALLEAGEINEAVRLSKQVVKLINAPVTETQGFLIRLIRDSRDRLTDPLVQAEIVASIRKQGARLEKSEKKWQTVGGANVRDTHSNVNGQRRPLEEPFLLAGGYLQYPGDGSLGAGTEEIINCRCATVYL